MRRFLTLLLCLLPLSASGYWQSRLQISSAAATCSFTRIDFTTGSLGTASLARSSSATYINVSGVLTTATTNAARFNYDTNFPGGNAAPSLTGPFLLVEPAATNLFLQSNAFGTSPWPVSSSITMVSGVFTSPDGTLDGWSGTTVGAFQTLGQTVSTAAATYNISVWSKYITGTSGLLFQINGVQGSGLALSTSIARYNSTIAATGGTTGTVLFMESASSTNGFFGMQLELAAGAGYFATHSSSYIATTTAGVTRSADVVTFAQPANCGHNTYTFSDGTTQTVSQSSGTATVPTNLNLPNIKFIDGST